MSNSQTEATALRTPVLGEFPRVEYPESSAELGELLAGATRDGSSVVPLGGGGALALGNPTTVDALAISTSKLNRIIDYQPTDMTLSVQAGSKLADVTAVLAEHGQMLPIEAPNPDRATIGGLLATALTGPRRYGAGSLRDVIIGIEVAYPDGTLGKAGGLVVKNVSGFDLMRIHHGALGTLGVITSANFKVLARPRAEFTVRHLVGSLDEVFPLTNMLRPIAVRPVALMVQQSDGRFLISARFEGRESGLAAVRMKLASILDSETLIEGADSAHFWSEFMDARAFIDPNELRLRFGASPTSIAEVADQIYLLTKHAGINLARFEIEPGIGQITVGWIDNRAEGETTVLDQLQTDLDAVKITILAAPDRIKIGRDVWGTAPETLELMKRLKFEFDPGNVLNPGRFAGWI